MNKKKTDGNRQPSEQAYYITIISRCQEGEKNMIHIVKRGTESEQHLIEHGAELIEVIQHGSELETQLIEEGAKAIRKGTWALYSENWKEVKINV